MRRLCVILSAWALLAACAAPRRSAGTLDGLTDAQIAARFAPRLVLHPEERCAPTSADELLALGATLVRRDGSLARPAPLRRRDAARRAAAASAVCPAPGRCGSAAGWSRARRAPRRSDAPRADLRARRPAPPARGSAPGWLARPHARDALPRARGRRPVLALLARRRLALDAARRDPARRPARCGCRGSTSTTRATGRRSPVGLSAERPLFVDWSAHCAGEWRPFAGATLVADPGGERTHPVSWIALGSHANLPAPVTARPRWWRCDPRVATFVHQRVDRPSSAPSRPRPSATASTTPSEFSIAPAAGAPQAFPLALVNRHHLADDVPRHLGRPRARRGRARRAGARLVAADADAAEALARPPRDDLRRRRAQPRPLTARLRGCRFPASRSLAPARCHRPARSCRGRPLHRRRVSLGLQLRAGAARARGALRRSAAASAR